MQPFINLCQHISFDSRNIIREGNGSCKHAYFREKEQETGYIDGFPPNSTSEIEW